MRSSKFVRINPNILLEYIYDDGNLISEPYSIVFNTNTEVYSFLSSLSETNNYLVLEADENSLTFNCYLPDNTQIDTVTLTK